MKKASFSLTPAKAKLKGFLSDKYNIYFILILAVGVFLRLYKFGTLPLGVNQDEAYAGYEAFCLANYGTDSTGRPWPVYFITWDSGMSVLQSYLAIPFVKIFGLSVYTIRLPQLICSILALPVMYLLFKEITGNKRIALTAMGLLAISPWNIMAGRWALDCNFAPSFLIFSLYFFVKGVKNNKYFLLAALFFGLTLYTYALTWLVVPLTVFFCALYLVISRVKLQWRYIIPSVVILFLLALPLLLFMVVNSGLLEEIRLGFMTIPKLWVMRDDEFNIADAKDLNKWWNLLQYIFKQEDSSAYNANDFGYFYKISIPFMVLGFGVLVGSLCESIKQKRFEPKTILLIATVCSFMSSLMTDAINTNKINSLVLCSLLCAAMGLGYFADQLKNIKYSGKIIITVYLVCTIAFSSYYFGPYASDGYVRDRYYSGVEECIEFVNEKGFKKINVDRDVQHPIILFHEETPLNEFLNTVEWLNYPAKYTLASSFTKYVYDINYSNIDESYEAYIIHSSKKSTLRIAGYTIADFGSYCVAYKE